MNYKQLLDASNALIVAVATSMLNMGLEIPLIWTQMSNTFGDEAKSMLDNLNMNVQGNDVKTLAESFTSELQKLGACQIADVVSVSDSEIQLDLGDCVFSSATAVLRAGDPELIPPCALTAIFASIVKAVTGVDSHIQRCTWVPERNTCSFTIGLE
ncbi:MAG: hypothetical protein ACXADL_03990 [Candidatus Thorarchaeota archaeon]|jgi:hypothetical protein